MQICITNFPTPSSSPSSFLTEFHARNVFNEISRFFPPCSSCSSLSGDRMNSAHLRPERITIPARSFLTDEERANRRRCNSEMRFSSRFAFHLLSIFSPLLSLSPSLSFSLPFLNPDDFHISLDFSGDPNYRIPIRISLPYDFYRHRL